MNNTAVVMCTYHRAFNQACVDTILTYKNQNFPTFQILFDNQIKMGLEEISSKLGGVSVSDFDDDFFSKNNFNRPINRHHRWGSHQNPKYFYAHFRMLCYYLKNPNYKYYWFFDDDVLFKGDLKGLLAEYEQHDDDFIAIQMFQKEAYPEFNKISLVSDKMKGSRGHWLEFAPGPGDNYKSTRRHMGCFFPIVRFSNKAMSHLINLNNEGYYGYSEGFVPTSLASDGLYVSSMLNDEDKYFANIQSNCVLIHKGMEFTWAWI